jgi:hypothetical protein
LERQAIFNRFALIANLNSNEAAPWMPICTESAAELENKLKNKDHKKEEKQRLIAAAAALSFYKYTLYKASSDSLQSISIGELSVKNNSKESTNLARIIWENAKASIADLLIDTDFYFKAINYQSSFAGKNIK